MRLYCVHVCTKFQGNRTINMLTVALKPAKKAQNASYDVITSRRRCVIKISTPSRHAPMPSLYRVQVSSYAIILKKAPKDRQVVIFWQNLPNLRAPVAALQRCKVKIIV